MDIFNEIVSNFEELEKNKISLCGLAKQYDFKEIKKEDNSVTGEYYYLYYGEKQIDGYLLVIEVETKDKYRGYGNDEEPYRNVIKILKNNKVKEQKQYIYFK